MQRVCPSPLKVISAKDQNGDNDNGLKFYQRGKGSYAECDSASPADQTPYRKRTSSAVRESTCPQTALLKTMAGLKAYAMRRASAVLLLARVSAMR